MLILGKAVAVSWAQALGAHKQHTICIHLKAEI